MILLIFVDIVDTVDTIDMSCPRIAKTVHYRQLGSRAVLALRACISIEHMQK